MVTSFPARMRKLPRLTEILEKEWRAVATQGLGRLRLKLSMAGPDQYFDRDIIRFGLFLKR